MLRAQFNIAHCKDVHKEVNTQKSKVLACGAPDWQGHVCYGGRPLLTVDSFVYLVCVFTHATIGVVTQG